MRIPSGTTDRYIYFVAVDATDLKTRETGLSSFTVYRSRNGAAAAAMTTPTINETDAANMPGVYELLLDEDTTLAAGNDTEEMVLHITHAGAAPVTRVIELYRPETTEGNTLDVTATGAGGIDWGNVENPSTAVDLSATDIQLCDTITTYTNNTVQTGDAFARVGAPTGASISADLVDIKSDTVPVRKGVAQAGGTGTITLDASANATTDIYRGLWITVTSGTGADQTRLITAYNGTTKVATVANTWITNPASGSGFRINRAAWVGGVNLLGSNAIASTSIAANAINSASIAASALNGKGDWNIGKTGYSLSQTFPPNFASMNLTIGGNVTLAAATHTGAIIPTVSTVTGAVGSVAGNVDGTVATTTNLTNLPSIPTNWLTADGLATDAVDEIADQVWDELIAGHAGVGSTGEALSAAGGSGDPWITSLPGAYGAGTAGQIVGDALTGHVAQTGDSFARLGAPSGASVSADIADVPTVAEFNARTLVAAAYFDPTADTVTNVTNLTNLPSIPTNWLTAAGLASDAVNEIVDQVWDELIAGHVVAGSTGEALGAAGGAGDPWITSLPGAYGAGTAGQIVGDALTGHTAQTGDSFARLGAPSGASVSADIADVPTVAEFNARTLVAAAYFDPTADTVTNVTNLTNLPSIPANWLTAAGLASDAVNEIADQVWDELIAGHLGAGSTGQSLNAAGGAGDPWITTIPGAYTSGQAGKIVGDALSGHIPQTGNTYVRLGAPAGLTISADIANVPTVAELNARTIVASQYATATDCWSDSTPPAGTAMSRAVDGIVLGTVAAAATTTSIPTSSLVPAAVVLNQFKGRIVTFDDATTTAALRGQSTDVTASTSGGILTVTALTTPPVAGDTFTIQ